MERGGASGREAPTAEAPTESYKYEAEAEAEAEEAEEEEEVVEASGVGGAALCMLRLPAGNDACVGGGGVSTRPRGGRSR